MRAGSRPLRFPGQFGWLESPPRVFNALVRESGKRVVQDPIVAQLVATSFGATSRAWQRLNEIAKEHKAGG